MSVSLDVTRLLLILLIAFDAKAVRVSTVLAAPMGGNTESVIFSSLDSDSQGNLYIAANVTREVIIGSGLCQHLTIDGDGPIGFVLMKIRPGHDGAQCIYTGTTQEGLVAVDLRVGGNGHIVVRGFDLDRVLLRRFPGANGQRFLASVAPGLTGFSSVQPMPEGLVDFAMLVRADGSVLIGGQQTDSNRQARAVVYRFDLGAPTRPPELVARWGDNVRDNVSALTEDQNGNVFAVGSRIWKLNPGLKLEWSTVLQYWDGLNVATRPASAATGPDGSLYLAGSTTWLPFETTPGAYQSEPLPNQIMPPDYQLDQVPPRADGFVARLSPDGRLLYATYLGGRSDDDMRFVSVDRDGWATVIGWSRGPGFPTRNIDSIWQNSQGLMVAARISPEGTTADYSTNLGYAAVPIAAVQDRDSRVLFIGTTFAASALGCDQCVQSSVLALNLMPARFPRIDRIDGPAHPQPQAFPGATLIIEGESFSPDARVWLGDREITPDAAVTERKLRVTIPLDLPLGPAELRVESTNPATGERSRSAPVRLVIDPPRP